MKTRLSAILSLTLALVGAATRAGESRIELGGELNARWLTPETGWSGRAVLILHGFASDSEGPANSQRRLAEALAARGIASLRINFRGEGDSARTAIESTFDGRLADTETARRWMLARPGADPARLGAFGWSLGGATALGAAGAHPDAFRAVVLWSSVTGDAHAIMTGGDLAATAAQAESTGVGVREIVGWKPVTLRREFFASFKGVDLDDALARHAGKFLSVRGSADYLPRREAEILQLAKGRPAEAVLIGGADHIFNVFEPASGHFDHAVRVTVDWLDREL